MVEHTRSPDGESSKGMVLALVDWVVWQMMADRAPYEPWLSGYV